MPKKKILIIDDDPSILELLNLLLTLEGYVVSAQSSGKAGVTEAQKTPPDLIVLDINMPEMSGYMVSNLLARDQNLKDIPIVLLTGTAQIAGNVTLEVPGVKQKILKPFDNQELLNAIESYIY